MDKSTLPFPKLALVPSRLRGMFNLNDGKWGRTGDAPTDQTDVPVPPAASPAPAPTSAPRGQPPAAGGPPDLEELWRDMGKKLDGLFGGNRRGPSGPGKGGNSGGGGFQPPSGKAAGIGLGLIAGAAFVVWMGSGFYVVQEGQQAVITRFGKFKGNDGSAGIANAGFNWRMPWPVEQHELVRVTQMRSVDIGRSTAVASTGLKDASMLTQDENVVDVQFTVQYRVKDAADFLYNNVGTEEAVVMAAESAIREVVGKASLNSVLNEKRETIPVEIIKILQTQLDAYKTGVLISNVNIKNVQPPEQVQAAFDDALKAGQDADRVKNEGQSYANDVIPRAEGRASRLKEEAEGYKARVVAQASGDSARFKAVLVEYQKAPQVTRDRMYLDAMQQIYSNTTKVLVDSRSGNNLLSLPLDRLLQLSNSAASQASDAAPATVAPAAAPNVVAPPIDVRSRDDARTRGREPR